MEREDNKGNVVYIFVVGICRYEKANVTPNINYSPVYNYFENKCIWYYWPNFLYYWKIYVI